MRPRLLRTIGSATLAIAGLFSSPLYAEPAEEMAAAAIEAAELQPATPPHLLELNTPVVDGQRTSSLRRALDLAQKVALDSADRALRAEAPHGPPATTGPGSGKGNGKGGNGNGNGNGNGENADDAASSVRARGWAKVNGHDKGTGADKDKSNNGVGKGPQK